MKFMVPALWIGGAVLATGGERVEFQEGAGSWSGTVDRVVAGDGTAVEGSGTATYFLDGDPEASTEAEDRNLLLRFDGIFGPGAGQVPAGATILSARLVLRTGDDPSGGPYVVGRLTTAFDGTTGHADLGLPGLPGARGSVARPVAAGFVDMKAGERVTADVTGILREWAGGAENSGFALYSSFTTDGWEVATSSHPRVEWRPKLVVEFEVGPAERHEFAATKSALIDSTAGDPTLDGSLLERAPLDADPDDRREALFEFGGFFGDEPGRIGEGERIVKAELVVTTVQADELLIPSADTLDVFGIFPMRVDWNLDDGDSDGFPDLDFGADGPTVGEGDIECAVAEFAGMGQDSEARADVTELVRAWRNGMPNHGVNVKMTSAAGDSWYISWPGTTGGHAPRLEVITVSAPAESEAGVAEFRNGVGGYAGTFQKRIDLGGGGRLGTDFTAYLLDGDPPTEDANDLLRFDGIVGPGEGQVPAGATVLSAGLFYTTGGSSSSSASDGPFAVGALTTAVDEATNYGDLAAAGAEGVRGSVGRRVGGYSLMLPGEEVRAEVGSLVQDWVNGAPNHGFGIFAARTTDAWEVATVCDVLVRRPRLHVEFTSEPVDELEVAAGAVALLGADDVTRDGAAFAFGLIDGDPEHQLLLGFDGLIGGGPGQLRAGAEVLKAWLVLNTGPLADDDSWGPFAVRTMETAWSLGSLYSDFGVEGPTEEAGQTGPVVGNFRGMGQATECRVDITEVVKGWQSGATNHGLVVRAGTSNSWWVGLPGGDPAQAPRIRIITAAGATGGFDGWAAAAGLPGLSRDDDGDSDGIPALVEYGLGLDPQGVDSLPGMVREAEGFSLTFEKGAEAAGDPGISYEIHRSDDLEIWEKADDAVETAESIRLATGAGGSLFLRLRIEER